jgi:hypothetical protein
MLQVDRKVVLRESERGPCSGSLRPRIPLLLSKLHLKKLLIIYREGSLARAKPLSRLGKDTPSQNLSDMKGQKATKITRNSFNNKRFLSLRTPSTKS